jgi:hypothetical protein
VAQESEAVRGRAGPVALVGDTLWLIALLMAPLAAVLVGASGPRTIRLNFGPGDAPYVSGFLPTYEINERVATRWSTGEATVDLPLRLEGGPAVLAYRIARPLPELLPAEVTLAGRTVDAFTPRRVFEARRVELGVLGETPLRIAFNVGGAEPKALGLKLDDVEIEAGAQSRLRLRGGARARPLALVALFFLLLRLSGFRPRAAALVTAPLSLLLAFGLGRDPWLVHRLLTGLPESLALLAVLGVAWSAWRRGRGPRDTPDIRWVTVVLVTTFLARAGALNHPDFYHPDFTIHARLVGVVRNAGIDFLRDPAHYLWGTSADEMAASAPAAGSPPRAQRTVSGLWLIRTGRGLQGMPYSVAFHALFAASGLADDDLLTALKLAGAALSVVPIALVWVLATRTGIPPIGGALLALVPTYAGELTLGALPALFGHAMDVGLLLWVVIHLGRIPVLRVWAVGTLLVAACQLAYAYSVPTTLVFLASLAALGPLTSPGYGRRWSAAVAAMGLTGALVAFAVYYRGFWDAIAALVSGLGRPASAAGAQPSLLSYGFHHTFWDWPFLVAGLLGLGLLLGRRWRPAYFGAWAATYVGLLGLRLAAPQAMRLGHENLFAAPLVCLGAGVLLAALAGRGRIGHAFAAVLVLLLVASGLSTQWQMVVEQFGRAR